MGVKRIAQRVRVIWIRRPRYTVIGGGSRKLDPLGGLQGGLKVGAFRTPPEIAKAREAKYWKTGDGHCCTNATLHKITS